MKVEGIDHVTIMVHDIEEARRRLGKLFELEFNTPRDSGADSLNSQAPIGIGSHISLATPLTPDGSTARGLAKRGEGLSVLALRVPNINEAIKEMEANGVRCIARHTERGALFHPKDLYGVMIDLLQA